MDKVAEVRLAIAMASCGGIRVSRPSPVFFATVTEQRAAVRALGPVVFTDVFVAFRAVTVLRHGDLLVDSGSRVERIRIHDV